MKKLTLLLLMLFGLSTLLGASQLQKAQSYDKQGIANWVVSEKLDGIRAYWDGEKLYTRKGIEIAAPKDFTTNFPPFELDGELWTKRDDFETIQSIVMDKTPSANWSQIAYNIFEAPNSSGDFFQRLDKVAQWFEKNPSEYAHIIPQKTIKDIAQVDKILNEIVSNNGEGVMIKNPQLSYSELVKSSDGILKYKKFEDTEGVVIAHNLRQDGTLKSLVVELPNQITFNLGGGFSKKEREKYPKIGEVVRFKYYGYTKNGKPKFASFLNIRKD